MQNQRRGERGAENACLEPAQLARKRRNNPGVVGVRKLTLEAGDGRKCAVSAADPCPTGNERCEQASTNGHNAECDLLHDVLSHLHTPSP
jgi:hypothetical protein